MGEDAREMWVGDTRIFIPAEGIVQAVVVGVFDTERAEKAVEVTFEVAKGFSGPFNLLVDLNQAGKSSPGARKIWKQLAEHPEVGKVAYFGLHPVARVIASFVTSVTTKEDVKFFRTEKEALAWLTEKKE